MGKLKEIFIFLLIFVFLKNSLFPYTGKDYLKMAIKAHQNGFYSLSNQQLEKFFNNPDKEYIDYAYLLYSVNLIKLNKLKKAEKKLLQLIKEFPDSGYLKESFRYLIFIYLENAEGEKLLNLYKEYNKRFGRDCEIERNISQIVLKKGISLFNSGAINESKELFQVIVTRFPESEFAPIGYYYLGLIFYQNNQFEKAKSYFEKSLPSISDKKIIYDIYLKIGDCYLNQGDIENATKFYDIVLNKSGIEELKLWALFQKSIILKKEKKYEKSEEYLKGILKKTEDRKLKNYALFEISKLKLLQEKWDDAESYLLKILDGNFEPLLPQVILQLGFLNFNKGKFDKSIKYFKDFISKYKRYDKVFSAYFGLGYSYYKKGDIEKAKSIWENILKEKPESEFSSEILFILGKDNFEKKRYSDAEKYFKKLINYFPESSLSSLSKPLYIRTLIFQKKYKTAKSLCEKFLKNKDEEIKVLYGEILYYLRDYQKAEKILSQISKKIPSLKAESLYFLGKVYLKKDNKLKAKEKFLEIITFYSDMKEWEEAAKKILRDISK